MGNENENLEKIKKELTGLASKDRPWSNLYKDFDKDHLDIHMSIYQMLEKYSRENRKNTALWIPGANYKGGLKISYDEYIKGCKKIAKSFQALNTKKEEIIPIILPNVPESRCSIYGLNYIGGTSYPILPSLPARELEKILRANEIDKVVMFNGFYEKYAQVLKDCHIHAVVLTDGTGMISKYLKDFVNTMAKLKGDKAPFGKIAVPYNSSIITWNEFIKEGAKEKLGDPYYKENGVAAIIGTSGTTGVPKGAVFTNESINAQAYQHLLAGIDYEKGDKILDILIQSISYGFSVMHYEAILGTQVIMIPNLITEKIAELMVQTNPAQFTGGPIHFICMARSEEFKNGTLKPMKNGISGGAKLPSDVEKTLNEKAIYVKQGYGSTECLGGATGPIGKYEFGSIGTPLPLTDMAIFKPGTDEELPYNTVGEICISGPTLMKGYLNNEEETKQALIKHSDGRVWLHTKDLGYCDNSGHFFFAERISDTFMRFGFNIHPNKINEFISSYKYVQESFVFGVPHKTEQEVPVAVIVLKPEYVGKEQEIKEFLINECYDNLDEVSIPYEWIFTDNLPRNIGGKVVKNEIIKKFNIDYSNVNNGEVSLQRSR